MTTLILAGGKGTRLGEETRKVYDQPKVSIVMPCYNVEKYLPQCIESVINQDYKNLEIILVDDGSPDRSGEIIDQYAKKDFRIHPLHQINGGDGNAINNGMKFATGKYFAIVETDDYVEPNMISSLVKAAEEHDAPVVKAGFTKIYSDGRLEKILPPFHFYKKFEDVYPEASNDLMLMESSIWAALYNLNFLKKNEIKMLETKGAAYQDSIFKFMVYSLADSVIVIPNSIYNYRVMTPNSSSKSTKNWDAMFENYSVLKDWLVKHDKFDRFVYSYYLHGSFDFLFHYGRISEDTKPFFIEKAKRFYKEGREEGVCKENARFADKNIRDYFWGTVVPFLNNLEENTPEQNRPQIKAGGHSKIKRICKKIYASKFGKKIWNIFENFVKRPFIWNKLTNGYSLGKSTGESHTLVAMGIPNSYFELYESNKKNVLVLFPWYQDNAAVYYVESILAQIKQYGYELHLFLYYEHYAPVGVHEIWDKVFYKHADNPYLSHTNFSINRPDGDHLDDWVDEDFCACVKRLDNHFNYKICFSNYLMYTKAFEYVGKNCKKIICTHDKFTKHNSTLINAGFPAWSCWFGVPSKKEEARGLKRSNLVLSIQEDDATFFREITDSKVDVITYPFIPKKNFRNKKSFSTEGFLTVGYIASSNPPNYFALQKLIKSISSSKVRLFIAGSVCHMVKNSDLNSNCTLLGLIDSLDDFYDSYDVYVNPDTFYSGMKCKTIEAMSYGAGIVCTKVASTNLALTEKYHNFEDAIECGNFLMSLSELPEREKFQSLTEITEESKRKYEQFVKTYDKEKLTTELLRGVE